MNRIILKYFQFFACKAEDALPVLTPRKTARRRTLTNLKGETMISKFLTNDKWLSDYALSCGYIETNEGYTEGLYRLSLEKEANIYHVKLFHTDIGRVLWNSYDTLTEARKAFKRELSLHNLKRQIPNE